MILLGTSGWQYRDWRGRFHPTGLPQRLWLEHFAARFATVGVNNAFYRLPERDTFAAWRDRTPDDFCVAVKMRRLAATFNDREPAYVYFTNDPGGAALLDAVAFAGLAGRAGRRVSQVPTVPEAASQVGPPGPAGAREQ